MLAYMTSHRINGAMLESSFDVYDRKPLSTAELKSILTMMYLITWAQRTKWNHSNDNLASIAKSYLILDE